ncbi:MAG TPA: hypothetical protein VLU41_11150 [Ideonella sp.]|nr:hypothetical protein [Ideonella sp.]
MQRSLLARTAASGSAASVLSIATLAARGRRDDASAWAPLNAPSHWLFGRRALRQDGASWRYSASGLVTHHLASLFWAWFYERLLGRRAGLAGRVAGAALVTGTAALVDLTVVPARLTPGFEHRLSARSLALVYAAFALGLAAGSIALARR